MKGCGLEGEDEAVAMGLMRAARRGKQGRRVGVGGVPGIPGRRCWQQSAAAAIRSRSRDGIRYGGIRQG